MARSIAITGVASGLGRALADRMETSGDRVIGVDRAGGEIDADLGSEAGREHAVAEIIGRAADRLDGLVLAAGVGPYRTAEEIARVNFFGAISLLDALLPALARGEQPAAVAVASIGGFFSANCVGALMDACDEEDEGQALASCAGIGGSQAYSSVKRALVRAVRRRAPEWGAAGVRLNALAPGSIDTPMLDGVLANETTGPQTRALPIPLGRFGAPEEVAGTVAFLLGPDSTYVHGSVLVADGGALAAVLPPDQF